MREAGADPRGWGREGHVPLKHELIFLQTLYYIVVSGFFLQFYGHYDNVPFKRLAVLGLFHRLMRWPAYQRSSSAVANRSRDASCPSIVSFNSTKPRVVFYCKLRRLQILSLRAVKCAVLLSLA